MENYQFIKQIGQGRYSEIWLVKCSKTRKKVSETDVILNVNFFPKRRLFIYLSFHKFILHLIIVNLKG